jgi:predicted dinucleotide-binding enzyme
MGSSILNTLRNKMNIGIIGSGRIGGTLGKIWTGKAHRVFFSSRNPDSLNDLIHECGVNARGGKVSEAVEFGELILFAPPYKNFVEAIELGGGPDAFAGKIVIDATNPFGVENTDLEPAKGETGNDRIREAMPDARIVKAINSVYYQYIGQGKSPVPGPVAATVCGDDEKAKSIVMSLLREASLEPVDLGGLENVGYTEPGGPFFNQPMTADKLTAKWTQILKSH